MKSTPLPEEFSLLQNRLREINALRSASYLMYWDQATYIPEGAADSRGEHMAVIEKMAHDLGTSDEMGRWLEKLSSYEAEFDSFHASLIRVAKKDFARNIKVPGDFSAEISRHGSNSYGVWKKARAANDFKMVEPILEKTLVLSRQLSDYLREPQQTSIGDPLIDLEDPGFSVDTLRPLFATLRKRLVPLLEKTAARTDLDDSCLHQIFPEADQLKFGEKIIRQIGYDFARGRQDKTAHPFMIRFSNNDVRITTRVKENDLSEALFSTVHEAGHALYELGIANELDGTPLGRGASSGVHESQSRLWENLVARSFEFWEHFYPQLQSAFPKQLSAVPLKTFHRAINRVSRSLIRTDADEVSYNLHVMIRFDLELDLLEGRLKIADLPHAWNERYRADLGLVPKTLSEGVLQDVHWFHGGVIGGVFQGYTIGNILSAQLFAAAQKDLPQLSDSLRKGEFSNLREWLKTHLHQHGRKYEGPDLIMRATGQVLDSSYYLNYLEKKYAML
jgi:carboxypeptidase Taq